MRIRIGLSFLAILAWHAALPADASAQWYLGGSIGGNHSQNATVSLRAPADNLSLDFHDVQFAAESNQGRRYYGLRLGRMGPHDRRLGFEVEMIHLKAIADTTRSYDVTVGAGTSLPAGGASPMNRVVQEYMMTHGVNLALFNVVLRKPLGTGRTALVGRAGGGVTFPHAETIVNGGVVHHYEFGGPGAQGAVGFEVRLAGRASAIAEYKLTYARPTIDIVHGTAWTTLVSHHLSVGLTIALTR